METAIKQPQYGNEILTNVDFDNIKVVDLLRANAEQTLRFLGIDRQIKFGWRRLSEEEKKVLEIKDDTDWYSAYWKTL